MSVMHHEQTVGVNYSVGPETAKHLWLYLVVQERGTARSP